MFGTIIKEWRAVRHFSQLDLSLEAETSARHVSFPGIRAFCAEPRNGDETGRCLADAAPGGQSGHAGRWLHAGVSGPAA